MIQTILAWLLVVAVIVAAYPWASVLTHSEQTTENRRWLTWSVTLALSIGALTLIMFWESLVGLSLTVIGITIPYAVVALVGFLIYRRNALTPNPSPSGRGVKEIAETIGNRWPERLAILALTGIAAAILFNAAYWPFSREDAIGIYDAQAKQITATNAIIPLTGKDSLYLAYPALMPLAYAYSYIASGWHNEYLARVISALLALGCLPATFLLGSTIGGRRIGWLSVMLFALAPTFGKWASAGYVDLPMAFYYALAALFAWRLAQSNSWRDALLSGVMLGLAAWTKNAALIGVPLLGAWLLLLLITRRIGWRQLIIAGAACAIIAGPWYVRNLIGAGFLIPATAWTDRAGHTLENLLVFALKVDNFALTGWLIILGVVAALIAAARRRNLLSAEAFLLWWTAPFFAAWWLFVSYDPRFLLLFLPPLCVLAGLFVAQIAARLPSAWSARITWAALVVALVASLAIMFVSVEFKSELIHTPIMSDATKHEVVQRK